MSQTRSSAAKLNQALGQCKPQGEPLQAFQAGKHRFAKAWREISTLSDPKARIHQFQQHLGTH